MAAQAQLDIGNMLPATLTAPDLTEEEFLALSEKFPDAFLEYSADGVVTIMPPTDPESAARVYQVAFQLGLWNERHQRGMIFGPDGGFFFRSGARRSPDVCWFDKARWEAAKAKFPGKRFPVFAPDFVIEVRSWGNSKRDLREKMDEYLANGVELGWLIDPFERTVIIYRQGQEPQVLDNPAVVNGDGPVEGFALPLDRVFTA